MSQKKKFVKLAKAEATANSLYLWGGQGEEVETTPPEIIQKMETSNENAARVLKCLAGKINAGLNMKKAKYFDCSGLVVYLLMQLNVIDQDYTAQGIYTNLCVPVLRTDLKEGDLCFISSGTKITHVGIYIGDNLVVEAAGRDLGVVQRGISKNKWNLYGRVKGL
ncbi:MAG: C40 family peptidase [Clostridia bacterium]|nr:C40 family peptidase [Clostridia bacterium]